MRILSCLVASLLVEPAFADDCRVLAELDTYAEVERVPEGAICSTYLTEAGTTGRSCYWEHGFRDPAAQAQAKLFWTLLETCRDGRAMGPDQQVNHPDSYDLREWATGDGVYALSVKDKGALNRSLVFLRFEPAR